MRPPHRNRQKQAVDGARELRKQMSLPEVLLWKSLRRDVGGYRFRRQVPIGPYTLDFYCTKTKLCIEVDGKDHFFRDVQDGRRDIYLQNLGITVLRIHASAALSDPDAIASGIFGKCAEIEEGESK